MCRTLHAENSQAARTESLQHAVSLFATLPDIEPGYVTALTDLGNILQGARDWKRQMPTNGEPFAVRIGQERNDAELLTVHANLAQAQWNNDDFTGAEASYDRATGTER